MPTDITQLMSPTLVFMFLCYFITLFVRKGLEAFWPKLKTNEDWKQFVLPSMPAVFGAVFSLVPKYPIPAVFIASIWSKMVWGLVAGILSTWAYDILQATIKRLFGVDINLMKSIRPAPEQISMERIPPPPPTGVNLSADISTPAVAVDASPEKKP